MKNDSSLPIKNLRKASIILLSYFLFAACMQHEENLAPRVPQSDLLTTHSEAGGVSAMKKRTFTAHLTSANEVTTNEIVSGGQGQAIFKLAKDGQSIDYKLIVANIDGVTQAHIHCGAAGVNGSVVVFLYGFNAEGTTVNGELASGTITPANLIPRADSNSCVGGLMTWDDLIERMQNGTVYVNVHTLAYPPGEIRGQIQ